MSNYCATCTHQAGEHINGRCVYESIDFAEDALVECNCTGFVKDADD